MILPALLAGTAAMSPAAADGKGKPETGGQDRPNILWLTFEDTSFYEFGCYGNTAVSTPNIDSLAAHGILFTNAWSNAPQSSPARSSLITGCYATTYGMDIHPEAVGTPEGILFPQLLRDAGYWCTNNRKTHYNTTADNKSCWDECSKTATYNSPERKDGQPFFSVFNTVTSHMGRVRTFHTDGRRDYTLEGIYPQLLELPPHVPDLPEVRSDYAGHLEAVQDVDTWVGFFLKDLKEKGLDEETIIFVFSDHGGCLPRGKGYLYETGLHVPLVVYFPEKWKHLAPDCGHEYTAPAEFTDLAPSVLSIAGIKPPKKMQGTALMGRYAGETPQYHYAFAANHLHHFTPVRAVSDGQFKYIRSYMPYRQFALRNYYQWGMPANKAWDRLVLGGHNTNPDWDQPFDTHPAEMLFDLDSDPFELHDLSGDPRYGDILEKFRELESEHIRTTVDLGFFLPTSRKECVLYDMVRKTDYPLEELWALVEKAGTADADDIPYLIEAAGSPMDEFRFWGTSGLAGLATKGELEECPEILDTLVGDSNPYIACEAAYTLVWCGKPEKGLEKLLNPAVEKERKIGYSALECLSLHKELRPVLMEYCLEDLKEKAETLPRKANEDAGLMARGILVNLGVLDIDLLHGEEAYMQGLKLNHGRRKMEPRPDSAAPERIMSFERNTVPQNFSIDNGKLSISARKSKLGSKSLKISWKSGATVTIGSPAGIKKASSSVNGGLSTWIYNEYPVKDSLVFSFLNAGGKTLCSLPFCMDFKGWRCIWAKFKADMGKADREEIRSVRLTFPESAEKGTVYLDILEFPETVSWQNMSDAQYRVNRTDFSLIPDFMGYRKADRTVSDPIKAGPEEISAISGRMERWYLGSGGRPAGELTAIRAENERKFIAGGVKRAGRYDIGSEPLFPWGAPNAIEGEKCVKFRELNEFVLLPLALDWRKNGNRESLEKASDIYDWFYDQGWADGSGMGTLTFEKLRSCGYFHSFFLLKDKLSPEVMERELAAIDWFSLFGMCHMIPDHKGEVADNLRALAIPKLIYALSLPDTLKRQEALTAYKEYMDNALGIAPGYFGTFKADFSGYHHRGPYHSAYYPHALYAGSLIAYFLHGTPYALSEETLMNLKNGLLNFRFFCAGADVPAGTAGRFPEGLQVLQEILPAFAYAALSFPEPDMELAAALKESMSEPAIMEALRSYAADVKSTLAYTGTVGEMELLEAVASLPVEACDAPSGSRFYPYSGLLVTKDAEVQFNAKGFSRYIWDFESSATENIFGRYVSYGHLEYTDFRNGRKSFHPEEVRWDWNFMPGATTRILPADMLQGKGGASSGHRNFSDQAFLAGVGVSDSLSMFSVRLHDIAYDTTFRADKSMFFFGDVTVCLGSGISSHETGHDVATTLLQSFDGSFERKVSGDGRIVGDGSFLYAVKDGKVRTLEEGLYGRAWIDHGKAPDSGTYCYFMLKDKDMEEAARLLSPDSPVEIIRADSRAHIVRHTERDIICGALFSSSGAYPESPVICTDTPIAYILENDGSGKGSLTVCDPDMRRPWKAHMGLLTDEDVTAPERPHETTVTLQGLFTVDESPAGTAVSRDEDAGTTSLTFSTVRGKNYRFSIVRIK